MTQLKMPPGNPGRFRATLDFSRPGKPTDNAFVESFNDRQRDECLNTHWFLSLDDARAEIEAWRKDFNESRPHNSLGFKMPADQVPDISFWPGVIPGLRHCCKVVAGRV